VALLVAVRARSVVVNCFVPNAPKFITGLAPNFLLARVFVVVTLVALPAR